MAAADWLRGRPDPALTDFWLDPRLPERSLEELVEDAIRDWRSEAEWAPSMAALAWRGDASVLEAARELLTREDPRARAVGAYVLGQLGIPERTFPAESAEALERQAEHEQDPEVLATIASAFGNLGAPYGIETLLKLRRHADARVREGAADALAGRDDERVFEALVELTADPEPSIRDWATFALGTLSPQDTPTLRDALAARLGDSDDSTRIEAVHGLALRGDARALEAVLDLLGEVGPHDDGGNAADTIWKRYALTQATVRLAALTGDARLKQHLPALDERLVGTAIEGDLRRAYDRVGERRLSGSPARRGAPVAAPARWRRERRRRGAAAGGRCGVGGADGGRRRDGAGLRSRVAWRRRAGGGDAVVGLRGAAAGRRRRRAAVVGLRSGRASSSAGARRRRRARPASSSSAWPASARRRVVGLVRPAGPVVGRCRRARPAASGPSGRRAWGGRLGRRGGRRGVVGAVGARRGAGVAAVVLGRRRAPRSRPGWDRRR